MKHYLEEVKRFWMYFQVQREAGDQANRSLLGGRGLREFDVKLRECAVSNARPGVIDIKSRPLIVLVHRWNLRRAS